MDMFSFIKECLLNYNYPLAHSMREEEIADIFKTSNRCFLITWMLKLLDSVYEEILEHSENDKELLSNIIHELGFCSEKENMLFMTGEIPVTQQVEILYNMFTFISDIKKFKEGQNEATVSNQDLTELVNMDLNLFPMYGEIKLLTPSERLLISKSNQENLLEVDISVDPEPKDPCSPESNFNEDTREFIDKLKMEFPKIKLAMEDSFKNTDIEAKNIFQLKPNSVEILKKCSENLQIISQFIKDINTIEDFEKQDIELGNQNVSKNSSYEMIKVLHREVLTILKYNRCL